MLLSIARFLVRLHSKIANFFVTQRKYEILSLNLQRHLRSIGLSELASDTLSETLPKVLTPRVRWFDTLLESPRYAVGLLAKALRYKD